MSCPEDRLGCVHLEGHKGEAFTYLLKGYFPHLSEGEEVRLVCVAGPERGPRSIGQRRAGTGTALASLCPGGGRVRHRHSALHAPSASPDNSC